jgi:putative transcriptional regulator
MTQNHPDINILSEYASGALNPDLAIAVNAHLYSCPSCRKQVHKLELIGGLMLKNLSPQTLPQSSFESLMLKIDLVQEMPTESNQKKSTAKDLPNTVANLMDRTKIKWRKVTKSLSAATLRAGESGHEVSLQRINAGSKVPEHGHRGVEMTVVLQGCFSDENGLYQVGDFLLQEPGQIHQPVSACNEDCLCLSVQQAPVKLTGLRGRLINPFLRLQKVS